ncbi:MAG: hypothetical protein AAFP97_01605 [Pseudomonadota bacterium]
MSFKVSTIAIIAAISLTGCATNFTSNESIIAEDTSSSSNQAETAAVATLVTAPSQTQANENRRQTRNRGGHSKGAFYEAYDSDGDESVSVAEYVSMREKGYIARDINGDDQVLPDEYVAEYEARLDQQLAEQRDRQLKQAYVRFNVLDKDKDGIISREEFHSSGMRMFTRLDTNEDKVVDENDTAERF